MISESDVVNGFMWLLGRVPSLEEREFYRDRFAEIHADNAQTLRRALICSPEFQDAHAELVARARSISISWEHPRTVFLHVEKTGGTTLHSMLAANFHETRVCPERHNRLGDWSTNDLAAFELYSGHYDYTSCRSIPGSPRFITMLREPKERLLSLFYFWKAHAPSPCRDRASLISLAQETSALEFFNHPLVVECPSICDGITGRLIRPGYVGSTFEDQSTTAMIQDPDLAFTRASQILASFAAFGLLERFDESIIQIQEALHLRLRRIAPQQVLDQIMWVIEDLRPVRREPMTEQLDESLNRLTQIDQRLYAFAERLFDERARSLIRTEELAEEF